MLRKYANVLIVVSLLVIVVTTSGCYTVLKMRAGDVHHPEYCQTEYYDIYDSWYDPLYYSNPYYYYSFAHRYYTPWTYWYCEPYWTYPYYYRTRYPGYTHYDGEPLKWQKSPRRRGFDTRTVSPSNTIERRTLPSRTAVRGESRELKKLRKVGSSIEAKPIRRSGISRTTPTAPRATGSSTPTVARQTSRASGSSTSKATSRSQSSAPSRRRGSRR